MRTELLLLNNTAPLDKSTNISFTVGFLIAAILLAFSIYKFYTSTKDRRKKKADDAAKKAAQEAKEKTCVEKRLEALEKENKDTRASVEEIKKKESDINNRHNEYTNKLNELGLKVGRMDSLEDKINNLERGQAGMLEASNRLMDMIVEDQKIRAKEREKRDEFERSLIKKIATIEQSLKQEKKV